MRNKLCDHVFTMTEGEHLGLGGGWGWGGVANTRITISEYMYCEQLWTNGRAFSFHPLYPGSIPSKCKPSIFFSFKSFKQKIRIYAYMRSRTRNLEDKYMFLRPLSYTTLMLETGGSQIIYNKTCFPNKKKVWKRRWGRAPPPPPPLGSARVCITTLLYKFPSLYTCGKVFN